MVTAELTDPPAHRPLGRVRASVLCTLAVTLVTAAAALAGAAAPELVSRTAPHPTLHPTLSAWASILLNNTRVVALPILLTAFGFHRGPCSRRVGDLLVGLVLGANAVLVGLELGRWQARLIPYLPHLPLEWAAIGIAAGVWLHARTRPAADGTRRALITPTIITVVVLAAAAAVEVLLTPHATGRRG